MKQKVVITGSRGLIGTYLTTIARSIPNLEIVPTRLPPLAYAKIETESQKSFSTLDFLNNSEDELSRRIEVLQPDVIVHLAAMSNVDECEKKGDEAFRYNTQATAKLHRASQRFGARFIFASTNAVYCGEKAPYSETSPRQPLHVYGRTKRDAEDEILNSGDGVIMRFILAFGWHRLDARENPLTQILRLYQRGVRQLKMVTDVYANTLYAGQAAEAIIKVIDQRIKHDTFNIAGGTRQNRNELACSIKEHFQLDDLSIEAVASSTFKELVPRPKDTTFDCSKAESVLSIKALDIGSSLKLTSKDELFSCSAWKDLVSELH